MKHVRKSFSYAVDGILTTFRRERNFRFEVFAAFLAILLAFLFSFSVLELSVVVLVVFVVLALEILNSAMEYYLDVVEARMRTYVKTIKDMLAGAVFIASLGAFCIGLLLYLPPIFNFLLKYPF